MGLLAFACEEHTNGGIGPDPTVGVCWDADRLNLWRVGIDSGPQIPLDGGGKKRGTHRVGARPCNKSNSPGQTYTGLSGFSTIAGDDPVIRVKHSIT